MSLVIAGYTDFDGWSAVETAQPIGQEWLRCDFEWGLEKYVTVQAFEDYRLILCNVVKFSKGSMSGIRYEPVLEKDLKRWNFEQQTKRP